MYNTLTWFVRNTFLDRRFLGHVDREGVEKTVEKDCPVNDLTPEHLATLKACVSNPRLRAVVDEWWRVYDEERSAGNIPDAATVSAPWLP